MKINHISVTAYGPLKKISWDLPDIGVVYDDNMVGKTSLVDLLVQFLFTSRNRSQVFDSYKRFNKLYPEVEIEIESGGRTYTYGQKKSTTKLKDLLGWEGDELFRLLCIRDGDSRLVLDSKNRPSMLRALVSLMSEVSTAKVGRIDSDIRRRCQITAHNRWTDRRDNNPPKLYSHIQGKIVPFLDKIDQAEEELQKLGQEQSTYHVLVDSLGNKEEELEEIDAKFSLAKAKKIEAISEQTEAKNKELEKYSRIREGDEDKWILAREKREKAIRALKGSKKLDEKGLEAKLNKIDHDVDESGERLDEGINQDERGVRKELRDLKNEESEIRNQIDKERGSARKFIRENVRIFLQKRGKMRQWADGQIIYYVTSSVVFVISILCGISLSYWFYGGIVIALLLGVLIKRKVSQFNAIEKKIERTFNEKFKSVLEQHIQNVETIEDLCEEIPDKIGQKIREEKELRQIQNDIRRLEDELEELARERSGLPEEIGKLSAKKEELRQKVEEQKYAKKESEQVLEDLRDRSGQPNCESFQKKLVEKRKVLESIRKLEAVLNSELDTDLEKLELLTVADTNVSELRSKVEAKFSHPKQHWELEDKDNLEHQKNKKQRELKELKAKIDRIENQIKQRESSLRSEYEIDPEQPQDLFSRKTKYTNDLERFIIDRIAGAEACKILENISGSYLEDLNKFFNSDKNSPESVGRFFANVMGSEFQISFNYDSNKFFIKEGALEYSEADLSSGGRRHLFYSIRLALLNEIVPEPAFLVLDDPFLYYHTDRKKKAIKQLDHLIQKGWQILCFTVDKETRNSMVQELDAEEFKIADLKSWYFV